MSAFHAGSSRPYPRKLLVICSGHEKIESAGTSAWIELSLDPTQPTEIRVGKRHLERTNPTLMKLVDIVDELV